MYGNRGGGVNDKFGGRQKQDGQQIVGFIINISKVDEENQINGED